MTLVQLAWLISAAISSFLSKLFLPSKARTLNFSETFYFFFTSCFHGCKHFFHDRLSQWTAPVQFLLVVPFLLAAAKVIIDQPRFASRHAVLALLFVESLHRVPPTKTIFTLGREVACLPSDARASRLPWGTVYWRSRESTGLFYQRLPKPISFFPSSKFCELFRRGARFF